MVPDIPGVALHAYRELQALSEAGVLGPDLYTDFLSAHLLSLCDSCLGHESHCNAEEEEMAARYNSEQVKTIIGKPRAKQLKWLKDSLYFTTDPMTRALIASVRAESPLREESRELLHLLIKRLCLLRDNVQTRMFAVEAHIVLAEDSRREGDLSAAWKEVKNASHLLERLRSVYISAHQVMDRELSVRFNLTAGALLLEAERQKHAELHLLHAAIVAAGDRLYELAGEALRFLSLVREVRYPQALAWVKEEIEKKSRQKKSAR